MVYGELTQPTGGYVYDRLIVDGLRACGDEVDLVDPRATSVKGQRPDVIVGDALCVSELGAAFERAGGPTTRVLLVHHFPSWEMECADRDALFRMEARTVRASDGVVATSLATAQRVSEEHGGLSVDVVVPGADRLPRRAREEGGGVPVPVQLLFVGSIVARKRLPALLDAIERLAEMPLSLTVVGDHDREPDHARSVVQRVQSCATLRERVTFAGVAGDAALAQAMARADALVLPSSLEGYGMVLTEALHAGLPVLAARQAAQAASIAEHDAVLVFEGPDHLEETLRRFIGDPQLREGMKRAAAVETLPRWAAAVAEFRSVLARFSFATSQPG
jgi:glycosyltransferase involved in cell wall biosynthesis